MENGAICQVVSIPLQHHARGLIFPGRANLVVESHADDATLVVSRRIKPGREREYDDWLRRITATAKEFPGFIGVTTFASKEGESNVRFLVWRFENKDSLENWKNSPKRLKFIEEVDNYASHHFAEATRMET